MTKGSQTDKVTDPSNAMVHGSFRVIRRENPRAKLATLEVESARGASTTWSIKLVLQKLGAGVDVDVETEYAERGGIVRL